MPDALVPLLELVAAEEGVSLARACKRLGWSRSELQRALAILGDAASLPGLDLIQVREQDGRQTLWLSQRARDARTPA
jgi:hypothetical protein